MYHKIEVIEQTYKHIGLKDKGMRLRKKQIRPNFLFLEIKNNTNNLLLDKIRVRYFEDDDSCHLYYS